MSDEMPEWESRARQVITALTQRLESHGDSCVEGCWNDARDMKAINDAIAFLDTRPVPKSSEAERTKAGIQAYDLREAADDLERQSRRYSSSGGRQIFSERIARLRAWADEIAPDLRSHTTTMTDKAPYMHTVPISRPPVELCGAEEVAGYGVWDCTLPKGHGGHYHETHSNRNDKLMHRWGV